MKRDYTALPNEYLEEMEELTDEEYGRLVRALQKYNITGEIPVLEGNEKYFLKRVINREDRYKKSFEEKAEMYREYGKLGGAPKGNQNARKNNLKQPKTTQNNPKQTETSKTTHTDTYTDTNTNTNNIINALCSEPLDGSELVVTSIPTNINGIEFGVTQKMVDEWMPAYPAVDILLELKKIRAWSLSNPTKRKTSSGMKRFINTWLNKAQDEAPRKMALTTTRKKKWSDINEPGRYNTDEDEALFLKKGL